MAIPMLIKRSAFQGGRRASLGSDLGDRLTTWNPGTAPVIRVRISWRRSLACGALDGMLQQRPCFGSA